MERAAGMIPEFMDVRLQVGLPRLGGEAGRDAREAFPTDPMRARKLVATAREAVHRSHRCFA